MVDGLALEVNVDGIGIKGGNVASINGEDEGKSGQHMRLVEGVGDPVLKCGWSGRCYHQGE
jgi:hypothetical protein